MPLVPGRKKEWKILHPWGSKTAYEPNTSVECWRTKYSSERESTESLKKFLRNFTSTSRHCSSMCSDGSWKHPREVIQMAWKMWPLPLDNSSIEKTVGTQGNCNWEFLRTIKNSTCCAYKKILRYLGNGVWGRRIEETKADFFYIFNESNNSKI